MRLKALSFIFLMLFIIPFAVASETYNNTGAVNQNFLVGTGIFNQNLVTSTVNSRSVGSDITNIPIVADLDGDGENEIIITVGNIVRLLDTNLDDIAQLTLEAGTYTTPVISDIDNDNLSEIIVANQEQVNISILEYNGSTFVRQKMLNFTVEQRAGAARGMISCNNGKGETEEIKCLMVSAVSDISGGTSNITAVLFNASDIGTPNTIYNEVLPACLPQIPVIAVADYDADGRDEFIFTYARYTGGGSEILFLNYVNDSLDLAFSLEIETQFSSRFLTTFNPLPTGGASCDEGSATPAGRNAGTFFTSPLVVELNTEAGFETVVGINLDSQDFRLIVFDKNGNDIDQHPAANTADGEIVGNAMIANVYGDTGTVEYCVLGHDDEENDGLGVLSLMCGSQQTGNFFDSSEFRFNTDGRFNISRTFPKMNVISHMAQHSNQQIDISETGLTDTTELVTSYGVFRLNDDTANGTVSVRNMDLIYASIVGDSACIQVDAQKAGSEEFICVDGAIISYINDGVENAPAEITSITYNPCVIDSVIKQNTSLQVSVEVTDQNPSPLSQDQIFSNVTIYLDDGNEESSVLGASASGTTHNHLFTLNKTITQGTIRIRGWDSENTDDKDEETQLFTVATNGIEFGDSTCTIDFVTEAEAEADAVVEDATLTVDATDNAITNALDSFQGFTGLAGTTVWLLFMMFGAFMIYHTMAERGLSGASALGTIAIVEVLAILLGARLGIISTGLVVTMVVIGVVIIGIFLGTKFRGESAET